MGQDKKAVPGLYTDFEIKVLFTKDGFKIYPEMDKTRFIEFCRKNSGRVGTVVFNIGVNNDKDM